MQSLLKKSTKLYHVNNILKLIHEYKEEHNKYTKIQNRMLLFFKVKVREIYPFKFIAEIGKTILYYLQVFPPCITEEEQQP